MTQTKKTKKNNRFKHRNLNNVWCEHSLPLSLVNNLLYSAGQNRPLSEHTHEKIDQFY